MLIPTYFGPLEYNHGNNTGIQAGLVLRDFVLTRLENLHHLNNFRLKAIRYRRSVAALALCRKLAESDVTLTPSVTCVDRLRC